MQTLQRIKPQSSIFAICAVVLTLLAGATAERNTTAAMETHSLHPTTSEWVVPPPSSTKCTTWEGTVSRHDSNGAVDSSDTSVTQVKSWICPADVAKPAILTGSHSSTYVPSSGSQAKGTDGYYLTYYGSVGLPNCWALAWASSAVPSGSLGEHEFRWQGGGSGYYPVPWTCPSGGGCYAYSQAANITKIWNQVDGYATVIGSTFFATGCGS